MFTSPAMKWESIVKASSSTHFGFSIEKCQLAFEGWFMSVGTSGAGVDVVDQFEDVLGTKFSNSAGQGEGKMIILKSFSGAQSAGTSRTHIGVILRLVRRFICDNRRSMPHWFDSHTRSGVYCFIEVRVGSVVFRQLIHKLSNESKRGWRSYVCCAFITEFHVPLVEITFHFQWNLSHDVLVEVLSEGNTMEVLHVMELLDDDKVGLQLLDLGGQVFSYLLNRFIIGQEVKNLIDLSSKDVNAPVFFN